jgi:hypothetical protein
MDPNFEHLMRDLMTHAQKEREARTNGQQVKWFRPQDYTADLFDIQGMEQPFKRDQANQECVQSISDPQSPGVAGDVVAAVTMIEELSVFERAFRTRHSLRRPRATALMLGRKKGHGSEQGVFLNNGVEYLRGLFRQASQTP